MSAEESTIDSDNDKSTTALPITPFTPNSTLTSPFEEQIALNAPILEQTTPQGEGEDERDGEALEWAQVIELQAFSERKTWIEEKIRVLEQMPPIEVFVGLDSLRAGNEEISSNVPTRAELQKWVAEHDKIEKETEIFDAGEFKELKKFTKAAAQRNLSPADTDLIEITLTTIFDLDKLLHLLRDRSEHLDLFGVRLTWEEQRSAAWVDYHKLINDLRSFLTTRAQWSPSIYENVIQDNRPVTDGVRLRRGSIASITSITSDSSSASFINLSRSTRFKLAEVLSKDAAQISSRISALRHDKISPTGKALDKLIEESRKPVPDALLDEQDRLENKGITEMENVGKFVMSVVMQWKKADEIYVENKKDQAAAQALIEEIEVANTFHPQARQDGTFISRANALMKRLVLRGNPASVTTTLLRPVHPLFLEQGSSNESIIGTLSSEMVSSVELTQKADILAKEYHASYEAVAHTESLCTLAQDQLAQCDSLVSKLENGVEARDGDGTPPNLNDITCLEPTSHSSFIALFPSLHAEIDDLDASIEKTCQNFSSALLRLDRPGIDEQFKAQAASTAEQLSYRRRLMKQVRDDVSRRVDQLRCIRQTRSMLDNLVENLEELHQDVEEGIKRDKWTSQNDHAGAPLTPESSMDPLPSSLVTPYDILQKLQVLQNTELEEISSSFTSSVSSLPLIPREWMMQDLEESGKMIDGLKQMCRLWELVKNQSKIMGTVTDEANDFRVRLEDLKSSYDDYIDQIFDMNHSDEEIARSQERLSTEDRELRIHVQSFVDGLSHRVPFLSSESTGVRQPSGHLRKRTSLLFSNLGSPIHLRQRFQINYPIDPTILDNNVRADCNQLSMTLSGDLHSLQAKGHNVKLARLSNAAEKALQDLNNYTTKVVEDINSLQNTFHVHKSPDLSQLATIAQSLNEQFGTNRAEINRSLSSLRGLIDQMESTPDIHDNGVYERMVLPRTRGMKEAETRFSVLEDLVSKFKDAIIEAERAERNRIAETARAEAEKKAREKREEEERLQREQEEKERQERERMKKLQEEELRIMEVNRLEREKREAEERDSIEREQRERQDIEDRKKREQEMQRTELERIEEQEKEKEDQFFGGNEEWEKQTRPSGRMRTNPEMEREQSELATKGRRNMSSEKQDDVFQFQLAPAAEITSRNSDMVDLQSRIFYLRKRLRSLNIHELVRPPTSTASLPTIEVKDRVTSDLSSIMKHVSELPSEIPDSSINTELSSLRAELSVSSETLDTLCGLVDFSDTVHLCDASFSDAIEHMDSYPALPAGPLVSSHISSRTLRPEQQLKSRLAFMQKLVDDVVKRAKSFPHDPRVAAEQSRIVQTWNELEVMGKDLLTGRTPRPASAASSGKGADGPSGSRSSLESNVRGRKKAGTYSKLSVGRMSTSGFLLPPNPKARRSVSGSSGHSRSESVVSLRSVSSGASTSRSVSGPILGPPPSSSSLFNSTYASRQRTTSASSPASPQQIKQPRSAVPRPRTQTGQRIQESPTLSEASSLSRSMISSSTGSTFSRGLRQSLPSSTQPSTPRRPKAKQVKKPYVADPKNKLDMAIGDVVNKMPININIEVVADTWKDQSGKYWIGDQDPKLCFCRILRSQTVMVRVGGGWQELSKFINNHFADLYRVFPIDSPSRGTREEKWISAATVRAQELVDGPPPPPRTPDSHRSLLPSFALSTPDGRSPQSIKTTPSTGSPLTPLQFMRRADVDAFQRPESPSKAPLSSSRNTIPGTPRNSQPVWRP